MILHRATNSIFLQRYQTRLSLCFHSTLSYFFQRLFNFPLFLFRTQLSFVVASYSHQIPSNISVWWTLWVGSRDVVKCNENPLFVIVLVFVFTSMCSLRKMCFLKKKFFLSSSFFFLLFAMLFFPCSWHVRTTFFYDISALITFDYCTLLFWLLF